MGGFLDLQNTLILLALSANFFFVVLVLVKNPSPDRANRFFIAGASSVVLWNFAMLLFRNADTEFALDIFSRALYAVASPIPYFFILFTYHFHQLLKVPRVIFLTTVLTIFPIFLMSVIPNGLIVGALREHAGAEPKIVFNLIPSILYGAYQIMFFAAAFILLIRAYFRTKEDVPRRQLTYIFLGTFVTAGIALVTNLYLPFVGVFDLNWIGQAGSVSMIAFISLAILQYKLFDIQAAATQLFVFILCSFLFIRIFSSDTKNDIIVSVAVFLSSLFFGYLVVRSVNLEIKQREEIDKLAKRLSETNWQLSRSNEQLRILDQRKSEFVSIASHQLRTPVTAIKGYASLLLEDSYGKIDEKTKDPIKKIFLSAQRLVEMINDFLNVSKIEQGTMTYTFTLVDMKKLATDLVQDFHVAAGEKKLDLAAVVPERESFIVKADEGKIRQIVSNIIDNAIKYTPKGSVRVILEKDKNRGEHGFVLLKIKDTGIGLSHDDLHHLFGKFTRGSEGQKVNTSGSGLGLYVAKKMLEAHKGNIWVDSEGQGKGSVFCVELPAENEEQMPTT